MRPLDGITVVTLEHAIAAPFCTRQLADLGARVIKVERPGTGDFARAYDERVRGLASHFVWTNRSKESLTLDVKHAEAQASWPGCSTQADVLVQNLAPGAAARLGLSYESLREQHPRLIVCDISGYGASGPYRDKKAYDLLIQSESGFLSITGSPDEPAKAGCSIADIAAGMYAYSNILAALLQRGQERARLPHRGVDARKHGRMDGLPAVLRFRRRHAAAARRRRARDDHPLWPVHRRRRQDGDAWAAERARVGSVLPRGARTAGTGQ
jgi:crotonobetainyl-CoA:carnitine CoA-transferase CaiB-like acyl-CoA transferase